MGSKQTISTQLGASRYKCNPFWDNILVKSTMVIQVSNHE